MRQRARSSAHSAAVAVASLALVALGASPASAASGEIEYSCNFTVMGIHGEGPATASFDTAVPDGLVVEVGHRLELEPFTGVITLPDAYTDMLRAANVSTLEGLDELRVTLILDDPKEPVDDPMESFPVKMGFAETPVPADGPMTLNLVYEIDGQYELPWAGSWKVALYSFRMSVPPRHERFTCEPVQQGEWVVIDAFEVVEAATPNPSQTALDTPTPVRPVLVQTDFAEDDAGVAPLLGVGVLMTLAAAAAGLTRGRKRATSRRH